MIQSINIYRAAVLRLRRHDGDLHAQFILASGQEREAPSRFPIGIYNFTNVNRDSMMDDHLREFIRHYLQSNFQFMRTEFIGKFAYCYVPIKVERYTELRGRRDVSAI